MLRSVLEVNQMIVAGKNLFLAGSIPALSQLCPGDWIGGSSPYFMDAEGAVNSDTCIFVTEVPPSATGIEIRSYAAESLPQLYLDAPGNGFSFLLIPKDAPFLQTFAQDAPDCDGFLLKPMVGWVTGVQVSSLGNEKAMVVDGRSQTWSSQTALAMHVALPANQFAELDIINIFKPGPGDVLSFPAAGFTASECLVNGKPANFAEYIAGRKVDTRLPLTADYCGSIVNVSLQSVDRESGVVHFYAPVFPGVCYRFADPVADYVQAIANAVVQGEEALFSCNCILNYLYGELEGERTGCVSGPITFGEIAHQLLNQTLVQLRIRQVA